MEQKLISLLHVLASCESQIDIARAVLIKSSKEAFKLIDTTGRNIISSFELSQFLEKHKIKLEQDEVRMVVQYYDILRKGKLDPESFQKALTPRNKQSPQSSSKTLEENVIDFFNKEFDLIRKTQTLRVQLFEAAQASKTNVFKLLDREDNDKITLQELEDFLQSQGARFSSEAVKAIFQRGDRNSTNLITQQDFEAFIAPDVTKKKVLAKQPDLNIATESEIRQPTYTQSVKNIRPETVPQNASIRPETTINRDNTSDNQGYQARYTPNPVSNGAMTISQLMDKYDHKSKEYIPPAPVPTSSAYQAYIPGYQAPIPSYNHENTDRIPQANDRISHSHYTPAYPSHHETQPYKDTYYPGMYANQPSSALNNTSSLYSNPAPEVTPSQSYSFHHKNPNHYPSNAYYNDATTAPRFAATTSYEPERSRNMNKSLSTTGFQGQVSKSSTYEPRSSTYGRGYSPSISYGRREPLSSTLYQPTYERPRYEHSPARGHDYNEYQGRTSSLSPTRYEARSSTYAAPSRDYSYQPPVYTPTVKRRDGLNNQRSVYGSGYAPKSYESDYRGYEAPLYGSDVMRKSSIAPQNQALRDWGKSSGYGPSVQGSRQGSMLYDRHQLQQKYNNLSRSTNMYA